jgi:LAS superfamily LD-carboxypeptidase LdcB
MESMLNKLEVTGRSRTHVVQFAEPRFAAQPQVVQAFLAMRSAADKDGFDLVPFSSFRDYDTQLRIWNQKFAGKKPFYDPHGNVRDFASLTERQVVECILNWSALPGGSRHQWGTEIDVVDGNAMSEGYSPKLLPQEIAVGGIFRDLHRWLDLNMSVFGFFRPYNYFSGGMYPEPWHLSFAPASMDAIQSVTMDVLMEVTKNAQILGRDIAIGMMEFIYEKHILNYVKPTEQRPIVATALR